MKRGYVLLFFVCSFIYAQDPFITTWQVEGPNTQIVVPIHGNTNNYTISFGDGTTLSNQTGQATHVYALPGIYTVTISGTFSRITFENSTWANRDRLLTVSQWGDVQWSTMQRAFIGCSNLTVTATDVPDLSQVTNLSEMFAGCSSLNQPLDSWDVSNVTSMESMFESATMFNQSVNNWNVSNVTNMRQMFAAAENFNQPLDTWDVSSVTTMEGMFDFALSFNQPIGNWDVSNVIHMREMFDAAEAFNQPLNGWDVSSVTATYGMFSFATAFDQPLDNWDTSSVTNMEFMFYSASAFNSTIDTWDLSNVTSMESMFLQATAFNQPLSNWDVSNVTNFAGMFAAAPSFNQPLNTWNLDGPIFIYAMFQQATSFNQDLSHWDFSEIFNLSNFVANSGLDTANYDALLLRFVDQGIEGTTFNAEGLTYCNALVHDYLTGQLNWTIMGDSMDLECSGNNISGTAFYAQDANDCDLDGIPLPVFMVGAANNLGDVVASGSDGFYNLNVFEGSYSISLLNVPPYFSISSGTSDFNFTTFGNNEQVDFCITANQQTTDLNVTLLPLSEVRPGFEAEYRLVVKNIGTHTVSEAIVNLTFDSERQIFIVADPAANVVGTDQLHFIIDELLPFESREFDIRMQTFGPGIVEAGDIITHTATVTPNTDDFTPNDNSTAINQVVVNAFDPNDIQVLQGEEIALNQTTRYLDYIIRFQNLGTASAVDVRIESMLDPQLDWSTFTPVSASHAFSVVLSDDNLKVVFDDIYLPQQDADDAGSNGFIAYKIKPMAGSQIGDVFNASAAIYFDFNTAVLTNTVATEVVQNLSQDEFKNKSIKIYPNPMADLLQIESIYELQEVSIYNVQGRKLLSQRQNVQTIDVSKLDPGIYFVTLKTNVGIQTEKLIKS